MSDIQTLIQTVQAESLETRGILSDTLEYSDLMVELLTDIRSSVMAIQDGLFEFFDAESQRYQEARLAAVERMREQAQPSSTTNELPTTNTQVETGLLGNLGLAGMLAGITAAISGYAAGVVANLVKIINTSLGGLPARAFAKVISALKSVRLSIVGAAETLIIRLMVAMEKIPKGIANVSSRIGNFFGGIGRALNTALNPKPIFDLINQMRGSQGIVGRMVGFLGDIAKGFGSVFTALARIAAPITGIIAAVRSVFTTVEEISEDASGFEVVFTGLKNLVKELISAFVTYPAELIKKLVSYTAGKLGFEDVEAKLDSFNIDEIFRELYDSFIDIVRSFTNYVGDKFYQLKRKFGFGEEDPEIEARIAQREIEDIDEEIASEQARTFNDSVIGQGRQENRDEKVAELEAKRELAVQRLNEFTSAESSVTSQQTTVTGDLTTASQQTTVTGDLTTASEQTAEASADTAEAIATLTEAGTTPGSIYVHDTHLEEKLTPLVEATSTFMNTITNASEGGTTVSSSGDVVSSSTSASNLVGSSITSNLLNNITGGDQTVSSSQLLGTVAAAANGILNAPVGQASREVQGQSSAPIVISSTQGGSTVNNMVNNSSTTVMGGGASARSSDVSHRRLQDRMQGI